MGVRSHMGVESRLPLGAAIEMEQIPGPLYKYLHRDFASKMVRFGEVRVGSLTEYQRLEGLDEARGDDQEGVERVTSLETNAHWQSAADQPEFFRDVVKIDPTSHGGVTLVDVNVTKEFRYSPALVYCVSDKLSLTLLERFEEAGKFKGFGICVRIDNPEAFFVELTRKLLPSAASGLFGKCEYSSNVRDYREPESKHPCFVKRPLHSWQSEVRGLWHCRSGPIPWMKVRSARMAANCEIVHLR
jgi:hypothetical protein